MDLQDYINKEIKKQTELSNGYFWGVFDTRRFYIADKQFEVLFETKAFDWKGNFTKEVKNAMEKYGIKYMASEMRTQSNIEHLKRSIELDASLIFKYNKRKENETTN